MILLIEINCTNGRGCFCHKYMAMLTIVTIWCRNLSQYPPSFVFQNIPKGVQVKLPSPSTQLSTVACFGEDVVVRILIQAAIYGNTRMYPLKTTTENEPIQCKKEYTWREMWNFFHGLWRLSNGQMDVDLALNFYLVFFWVSEENRWKATYFNNIESGKNQKCRTICGNFCFRSHSPLCTYLCSSIFCETIVRVKLDTFIVSCL